jgi:ketosteroid isomerase-like protein
MSERQRAVNGGRTKPLGIKGARRMQSAVQSSTKVDPLGRLIDAIAAGDVDAAREAYAPDARIWHNTELREQSVDENVRVLRWVMRNIADLRYEDIRREKTERGYVQQHVLRGTAPGGEPVNVHACIVVETEGDRITRLHEYIDGDQIAPLKQRA